MMLAGPGGISGWQCSEEDRNAPKPTPIGCTDEAVLTIEFPDCSDGRLDTGIGGDHREHMAYAVEGVCPVTHPIKVPELTLYTHYPLEPGAVIVSLASGDLGTIHADYFDGWDRNRQLVLVNQCLNGFRKCASGKATV